MNSSDSSANSEHSEAPEPTSSGDTGQSRSLWRKAKELLKDERVQKAVELLKDERVQTGISVAAAAAVVVTRSIVKAKSEPTGKSASTSSSKLNFLTNLVDELQQARSARRNQVDPGLSGPAEPTLPLDAFPAPIKTIIDVFQGPHWQTRNAGPYSITYDPYVPHRPRIHIGSPEFTRMLGGSYDIGSLRVGQWYALYDRSGFQLPISLRKTGTQTIEYRIDPDTLNGLPKLMAVPGS